MTRNPFNRRRFGSVASLTLALWVLGAMSSSCQASILQPDFPDGEAVLAAIDRGQDTGNTSSDNRGRHQESPPGGPEAPAENVPYAFDFAAPTPGGSSSSSSPSSGASSGGPMSLAASSAIILNDDQPSTRLAICQSLSLPTPPGVELLRPPQA